MNASVFMQTDVSNSQCELNKEMQTHFLHCGGSQYAFSSGIFRMFEGLVPPVTYL